MVGDKVGVYIFMQYCAEVKSTILEKLQFALRRGILNIFGFTD